MSSDIQAFVSPEVLAFAAGFPVTILHAGVSLAILVLGCAVYGFLSPIKEVLLIREGSTAATITFAGAVLGLAIPLAVSLMASASWVEITLWGLSLIVVQLLVFRLIDFCLTGIPKRVREGETDAGVLLAAARVGAALIVAAAVAG